MTDTTGPAQPVGGNRAPGPDDDRKSSSSNRDGKASSTKYDAPPRNRDARKVVARLNERRALMEAALEMEKSWLSTGGAVILQTRQLGAQPASQSTSQSTNQPSSQQNGRPADSSASQLATEPVGQPSSRAPGHLQGETAAAGASPEDVLNAVKYRLAITDLFIEKAQYHLGQRALIYSIVGIILYLASIGFLAYGAQTAIHKMMKSDSDAAVKNNVASPIRTDLASLPRSGSASPTLTGSGSPTQAGSAWQDSAKTADVTVQERAAPSKQEATGSQWISLLRGFIVAFTAYGFIVLTAVALSRIARACLDQRERLLAKRHSLRQGRLYLHLTGGNVTIEEIEHAFDWNHEQYNAFTYTPTDAKAPWGTLLGEIVKVTPDLVKAGVSAAQDAKKTENLPDKGPKGTIGSSR